MTDLICVTCSMQEMALRPFACRARGEHLAHCDDSECTGCAPRPASRGLLCEHCWEKAENMVARIGDMVVHLRSVDSGGQALGERVATSMQQRLPIPLSWLAADEMLVALGGAELPSTASIEDTARIVDAVLVPWRESLEQMVSTHVGAVAAVTATMHLQRAFARWPGAEVVRREIPRPFRCPKCNQLTLYRQAPIEYLGDIAVHCSSCKARFDWWEFAAQMETVAKSADKARKDEARRLRKRRSA